ncbi:hypothetical protein [Bacillus velezensis]|uniref:hypothetical protein n=2 Tax=Bacillus TaxID=1386 RepID=UPI000BC7C2A4|nr:hypothetical protein BHU79_16260 [Bacillus velezensis]
MRRLLPPYGPAGKMNSGRAAGCFTNAATYTAGVYKKHSGGGLNDTNLVPQGGSGKKSNAVSHGFFSKYLPEETVSIEEIQGCFRLNFQLIS